MKLIHFWAAVDRLAATEAEKARALGLSERAFRDWKRKLPRSLLRIAQRPDIAAALARDAQECGEPVDDARGPT